jgi:hypothetical protein
LTEVFRTELLAPLGIRKRVPKGTQLILGRGVGESLAFEIDASLFSSAIRKTPTRYGLQRLRPPGQSCVVQGSASRFTHHSNLLG